MGVDTPDQDDIYYLAESWSALANPGRILILYALGEKPCLVHELTAWLHFSQQATSRHLKILLEGGLVHAIRRGNSIEYSLDDKRLINVLEILRSVLRDQISSS